MTRILYTILGLVLLVGLGMVAAYYSGSLGLHRGLVSSVGEYQTPVGYKTYTNTQYGFVFDYLADDQLTVFSDFDLYGVPVFRITITPPDAGEWRPLGFGESADWLTRETQVRVYKTLEAWEREKQQSFEYQEGIGDMRGKAKTVWNNGIEWQVFYLINEESGQSIDVWMGVLKSGYGIYIESESDWGQEVVPQETWRSVRNL